MRHARLIVMLALVGNGAGDDSVRGQPAADRRSVLDGDQEGEGRAVS